MWREQVCLSVVRNSKIEFQTPNLQTSWSEIFGILKRCIRLVLGLNDLIIVKDENGNEKRSTNYAGRPIGDCPELMPLDNSLFRDLRYSFNEHVTLTCMAPHTEPRRFSKAVGMDRSSPSTDTGTYVAKSSEFWDLEDSATVTIYLVMLEAQSLHLILQFIHS